MVEIETAYQEALDYLYHFVDYSLVRNFRNAPDRFNLDRMVKMLDLLGNPHKKYPIIHIAGTKGKGSTSAFTASALMAAGYRVGFYTSPHLQDFSERIQVNGVNITHEEIVEYVNLIKPITEQIEMLTWFELTTAMAFLHFARQNANVAVVEVGLGGRLDATNVVDPLVAIITSLSYDHMNILGDTLAKIAGEKAGIIKTDRPVVLAPQKDEARHVVENTAKEKNAPVSEVGRDVLYSTISHSLEKQNFVVWNREDQSKMDQYLDSNGKGDWRPLELTIPLLGLHQVENAVTAFTALQIAEKEGLKVGLDAIVKGFANVKWPGRFEVLCRKPLVIIDSAHNRDSALRLRLALDDYLPGMDVVLVFGASEDKDIDGMFAELLPRVKQVVATQSIHPRAIEAEKLVEMAHQHGCAAQAVTPVEAALEKAVSLTNYEGAVVVCGSLFVAAAAREAWNHLSLCITEKSFGRSNVE